MTSVKVRIGEPIDKEALGISRGWTLRNHGATVEILEGSRRILANQLFFAAQMNFQVSGCKSQFPPVMVRT